MRLSWLVSLGLESILYEWQFKDDRKSSDSVDKLLSALTNAVSLCVSAMNFIIFLYLKGCGTVLKKAPPAAARETLPIFAAKLESIAQCGTVPVPPITGPPKMNKSWLIRRAAQYLGKMKEKTVVDKRGPMNSVNYLPHWPRSRTKFRKGKA